MPTPQDGFEEPGDVQDIRLVVDTIPTLAWSARPDGSADFFNQRWLDYTGLSAKQASGSGWEVAIHPDDLPRILATFRQALASVKSYEVEGRFRRFDGAFRWFLFRGLPLRDSSGKVVNWYGTNTDLEEWKRAEDALRKSEERWRSVFENSAIGRGGIAPEDAPGVEGRVVHRPTSATTRSSGCARKSVRSRSTTSCCSLSGATGWRPTFLSVSHPVSAEPAGE